MIPCFGYLVTNLKILRAKILWILNHQKTTEFEDSGKSFILIVKARWQEVSNYSTFCMGTITWKVALQL